MIGACELGTHNLRTDCQDAHGPPAVAPIDAPEGRSAEGGATVPTTITPPATLPSEAELREAINPLRAAADKLAHVNWMVSAVGNVDPDEENVSAPPLGPTPTLDQMGLLLSFVIEADGRLDEIRAYVSQVRGNLKELDYARIVRSGFDPWRENDA